MASTDYAVLTAMGADRIGIVEDLTAIIVDLGCNINESRMAVLGGEFAVIMLIEGPARGIESLLSGSMKISADVGLGISVKPTVRPARSFEGRPYLVESSSLDSPGILHAVSRVLRGFGINIEDCETDISQAPFTGASIFRMRARIIVPASVSISRIREGLSALEHDRDLDISLSPVSSS